MCDLNDQHEMNSNLLILFSVLNNFESIMSLIPPEYRMEQSKFIDIRFKSPMRYRAIVYDKYKKG